MSLRTIVTARSITDNNQQIFIQCKDVYEALNIAGKLNQIELREHTYSQVRLRSTKCSKLYKDMTNYFLNNGA